MKQWFENKSVAVVGNAQSLFDNSYGDLIDSCDVVCRINVGIKVIDPVAQGQKTDVHVFSKWQWIESLNLLDYNRKNFHTSYKGRDDVNQNIEYFPLDRYTQLKTYLNLSKKEKLSTGFLFLDYIERSSPLSVSLFGFDWKKTPTYYENDPEYNTKRDVKKDPHVYDKEKTYISNMGYKIFL
jgi:hypothetical protein